jgi:hypothetical protein
MSYYGNSSYQPYSGKSPAGNTLADSNKTLIQVNFSEGTGVQRSCLRKTEKAF